MAGMEGWGDIRKNKKQRERRWWMIWVDKGSDTGCPLAPLLFTIYGRYGWNVKESTSGGGGSVVGREKVWSLVFANDLVKVKRNLKKWWRARKRTVCEEEKARRECWEDKNDGEWVELGRKKNRTSKRVRIPLGYTFNKRATNKAHIKEIVRKANKVVGCVWVKKLATEIKMSGFFWIGLN
jgi:hypothetical protein